MCYNCLDHLRDTGQDQNILVLAAHLFVDGHGIGLIDPVAHRHAGGHFLNVGTERREVDADLLHPVIHLDNGLPRCLYHNACVLGAVFDLAKGGHNAGVAGRHERDTGNNDQNNGQSARNHGSGLIFGSEQAERCQQGQNAKNKKDHRFLTST